MNRRTRHLRAAALGLVAGAMVAPLLTSCTVADDPDFAERLEARFGEIEPEFRPDVRWWLASGHHTDETLVKNVAEIADSGFGSAEILAMPEEGADPAIYGWGSDEWIADTELVIREATERGLGFALTSGTHWASANLPDTFTWQGQPFDIDSPASSKELDYATIALDAGGTHAGELPLPVVQEDFEHAEVYELQGVVAARVDASRPGAGEGFAEGTGTGRLDPASVIDLTDEVEGTGRERTLNWTAPEDGDYVLLTYWLHGTGQTSEPSVSTNYTINYMDPTGVQAFQDYWNEYVFTDELQTLIDENGRGEIYMDSLELEASGAGALLWGSDFRAEFLERRGYDVTPYLPYLTAIQSRQNSEGPRTFDYEPTDDRNAAEIRKVRDDYSQTFTELYEQNVLEPLQSWLHEHNLTLRAQPSYGTFGEISTPARYLDGVEIETFAQNGDVDLMRGMLGSANMYGTLLSSETGATWFRSNYYDMDYWTQISYLQFVGGVNRTVFHGYSAIEGTEEITEWPGHEGMYARYAERMNSRQPASMHYPAWTEMLGRNQKVLRQGVAQRDIAILRTDNHFINYRPPFDRYPVENNFTMHDEAYFWQDLGLQHAGYSYDYFSPQLLEDESNVEWTDSVLQPDGPAYKAVVLYQDALELSAAERLLEIAEDGMPVILVNGTEERTAHDGARDGRIAPNRVYEQAASTTRSLGDDDEALRSLVERMEELPNVSVVDGPENLVDELSGLEIAPRVANVEPTADLLTISRLDAEEEVLYTFAYSYKFDTDDETEASYDLRFESTGVPYTLDDWSGEVERVGQYRSDDDGTTVPLSLAPGEAAIIALDLSGDDGRTVTSTDADGVVVRDGEPAIIATQSGEYESELSDGETVTSEATVPEAIELGAWDLTIEDWNAGERREIIEEKFGHTTTEVYYETEKVRLDFPNTDLVAWRDLPATAEQLATLQGDAPAMDQVSGVGTYTTSVEVPSDWPEGTGALLELPSTGGGTTEVTVNGETMPGLDLRSRRVDVSDALRPGTNEISIVVTSTLTNRLIERGYEERVATVNTYNGNDPRVEFWGGHPQPDGTWANWTRDPQDYGLQGVVTVRPYVTVPLR